MPTPALEHIRTIEWVPAVLCVEWVLAVLCIEWVPVVLCTIKKNLIVIPRQQVHGTPQVHGVDTTLGIFCSASLNVTEMACRRHTTYSSPVRDPQDKRQLLRRHGTLSSDYSVFPDGWQLLTAPGRHGFDPAPVRVRLVVDTVALEQVPL